MAVTAESFRWLDILEKEFDKAYVDLDLLIGDLDSDEPEMVYNARKKMTTLSSCFAQLTHKAQTIFQNNAKNEAELVNMRSEMVETKTRCQCLEEELHSVLVQLHKTQLQQLSNSDDGVTISNKLQQGLILRSPVHQASLSGMKLDALVMSLENWKCRLEMENESLRQSLVSLQAEVCGARLASRYLDKELAGRIQQLQLLGRSDMSGDARDRLWSQLEAEILLQRHKTVIRAVRQRGNLPSPSTDIGSVRTVTLNRHPDHGLGISITGGREHGVPILISELEPGGNSTDLYVGDSVLSVNGVDLSQASHQEAVSLLNSQTGSVTLQVQYLASGADESEEDNDLSNLRYRFFEEPPEGMVYQINGFDENNKLGGEMLQTPTAPRTPDSSVREESDCSYPSSPAETQVNKPFPPTSSTTATSSQTPSPHNYGVTTLQKIFRSFTPSREDKVTGVSDSVNSSQQPLQIRSVEPESPSHTVESPTVHMTRKGRETSQLFHPDTEAMTLIDGLGDSSFGTPV